MSAIMRLIKWKGFWSVSKKTARGAFSKMGRGLKSGFTSAFNHVKRNKILYGSAAAVGVGGVVVHNILTRNSDDVGDIATRRVDKTIGPGAGGMNASPSEMSSIMKTVSYDRKIALQQAVQALPQFADDSFGYKQRLSVVIKSFYDFIGSLPEEDAADFAATMSAYFQSLSRLGLTCEEPGGNDAFIRSMIVLKDNDVPQYQTDTDAMNLLNFDQLNVPLTSL